MQELLLAKVESAAQAAKVSALAGQTATVTKVSAVTKLATITPAAAGQAPIIVKLDAARQVGEVQALVGKTVMIGKTPTTIGGIGNWISLAPVAQAKTGAAVAGATAEAGRLVMMKVDGVGATQLPALAGKTFTVAQPPVAAGTKAAGMVYLNPTGGGDLVALGLQDPLTNAGTLVGKTFTVAQSPVVGGTTGKFLVLKPMAAKAAAGGAMGVKFVPAAATGTGGAAAVAGAGSAAALMATGAGTVKPLAAAGAGSTILGGKGVALGLGLGLGAWGPVALGIAGIVGATTLYAWARRRNGSPEISDDEILQAAVTE